MIIFLVLIAVRPFNRHFADVIAKPFLEKLHYEKSYMRFLGRERLDRFMMEFIIRFHR